MALCVKIIMPCVVIATVYSIAIRWKMPYSAYSVFV